jgi:hypothetical protein
MVESAKGFVGANDDNEVLDATKCAEEDTLVDPPEVK